MSTYAIVMIVGVIAVVGGWLAYFIWDHKQRKEEEQQPKPQAQRVQKTKNEVSDWARKMAEFKSPAPKRPAGGDGA